MNTLSPAHLRLITAIATTAAQDYLRSEAARHKQPMANRPNPVPLPATDKAA